jgi:hypothetical protein
MYPITRLGRLAALTIWAAAAAGCASPYAVPGFEVSRFHSYAWSADIPAPTGDPRLDNNRFFDERLRSEVDARLADRGFEITEHAPDLLVHYHASMTQRIETRDIDRQYGSCEQGNCQAEVFDAGTILIDLVDARTQKMVWRGWVEGSMDGMVNNQEWLEARVAEAVSRIMEQLPRRLS